MKHILSVTILLFLMISCVQQQPVSGPYAEDIANTTIDSLVVENDRYTRYRNPTTQEEQYLSYQAELNRYTYAKTYEMTVNDIKDEKKKMEVIKKYDKEVEGIPSNKFFPSDLMAPALYAIFPDLVNSPDAPTPMKTPVGN